MSSRRGGFCRCDNPFEPIPTHTLHSLDPASGEITTLSWHETNEWHPAVLNDGRIVYCRWDYVDRDTNIAHHLWLCYPDGRDPRSYHGNYPANLNRNGRPWMEQSIRAIPGSHRFVATAARLEAREVLGVDLAPEPLGAGRVGAGQGPGQAGARAGLGAGVEVAFEECRPMFLGQRGAGHLAIAIPYRCRFSQLLYKHLRWIGIWD